MKDCNACGQTNKNASALCIGGRTHDYGEPPPSQLDRIVAYILEGHGRIEALDELVARSREEAITNGEAIDRIEAKLDRLLAMKEEA